MKMRELKKPLLCALCACTLIFTPAFADEALPSPEPPLPSFNPTFTPAPASSEPFNGLVSIQSMQGATDDDVVRVQIRLRDLHYFNFKPTGRYQSMTADAAKAFQLKHTTDDGSPMIADGTIGSQTMTVLFRHNVTRADISASIPIGTSSVSGTPIKGAAVEWESVRQSLRPGNSYQATDYNTGTTFMLTHAGGQNHAEMESTTAADTATVLQLFGGEYNFSKRAITLLVDGRQIAASMQAYPHGSDTVASNNMEGHFCVFFENSLSHVGNLPDTEHQRLIYTASGR